MSDLADARRIHERIVALYARTNDQGFWFRNPASVTLELSESLRFSAKVAVADRDRIARISAGVSRWCDVCGKDD